VTSWANAVATNAANTSNVDRIVSAMSITRKIQQRGYE
jgi:hypothetical protein